MSQLKKRLTLEDYKLGHLKAFAYTAGVCVLVVAAANRFAATRKLLATDAPPAK